MHFICMLIVVQYLRLIILVHKAYRALSLIVHPDHSDESAQATEKFQVLAKVHEFLMCEKNRELYDATGNVDAASVIIVCDEDFQNCKQSYVGSA